MTKIKCNCPCHQPGSHLTHIKPCCAGGFIELPAEGGALFHPDKFKETSEAPSPQLNAGEGSGKVLRWVKASERLPGGPRNKNSKVIVRPLGNSKLATVTFIWSSDNPQWYDTRYFLDDTEWLEEIDGPTAQPTESPALGEVPADVMEWIRKEWLKDSNRHDFRNYEEAAIAMYRKIMEEMSATENPLASYWFEKARQCLVERNDFKGQLNRTNEQLANLEKNISTLTDDALKISEERDAFREGLERISERRQGFQRWVIASELLKKYPKQ